MTARKLKRLKKIYIYEKNILKKEENKLILSCGRESPVMAMGTGRVHVYSC